MIKDLYTKTKKNKLSEILDKKEGSKNQTMIQLEDMQFLLGRKGKEIEFNKKVGNCYCHIMNYEKREFFDITGTKIYYDKKENTIHTKTHYSK